MNLWNRNKIVKLEGRGSISLHNWFLNERTMGTQFVDKDDPKIEYDLIRVIIKDDGVFGEFKRKGE